MKRARPLSMGWIGLAGILVLSVAGCGNPEPPINRAMSPREMPRQDETDRMSAMQAGAEEKSPFNTRPESPRQADPLQGDAEFHASQNENSPME